MKSETVKMAGTIISMLIVFLVFLWALNLVIGSPDCDDLANTTAYNLKVAIDEVSTEKVQFINFEDKPEATEYRTAVIKLCQEEYLFSTLTGQGKVENPADNIYSWILRLSGGEPQYQIYYEIFPEGGAMWKESYPWNGGAGSTVLFWGVLRGVSFGIERLSPLIGTAKGVISGWKIFKWLKGADDVAEDIVTYSEDWALKFTKPANLKAIIIEDSGIIGASWGLSGIKEFDEKTFDNAIYLDTDRRKASEVVEILNQNYSKEMIKSLADSNFIRKNDDGSWIRVDSRIAVNNKPLPMIFPKKEFKDNKWQITEEDVIYVYQAGGGELDPTKADWNGEIGKPEYKVATRTSTGYNYPPPSDPSNYVLLTYKPNEIIRDMYNELIKSTDSSDKQKALELESYWYWGEENVGTTFDVNDALKTKYGFEIYNMGAQKAKDSLNRLKSQGVLTKDTVLHSGDISLMLEGFRESAFAGDTDAQNIQEAFLTILSDTNNGVYGKICHVLKGTESCIASIYDMFDALQSDLSSDKKTGLYHPEVGTAGIMLLWNNFSINIDIKIMDILMMHPTGVTQDYLLLEVGPFNKVGYSDAEIIDIYNKIFVWFNDTDGGNKNINLIPKGMGKFYLKRLANALKQISSTGPIPDQYKWAVEDLGFIIGLYKQEASTSSTAAPPIYQRGATLAGFNNKTEISFEAESIFSNFVKRELFWNVEQMITPSSGIAKGFLLQSALGCLGNSLCVYSHGALMNPEKPFYLNEEAKDFKVRLWRPVSPLVSGAGVQGFLMQVPSHPRFHVVSPCFGKAKVWKSKYEGENTIFIEIEKFDMNDTASNYCYADEGLISTYATIWFLSDVGRIAEAAASSGLTDIAKKSALASLSKTILDKIDPITLVQGIAEAWVSWPRWPFKSLTWETMTGQSGTNLINRIKP